MRSILILLTLYFLTVSCNKNSETPLIETSLLSKSLDSIKYYVQGNWQLVYEHNGYTGQIKTYTNNYMAIFPIDSISWKNGLGIIAQSRITFRKVKSILGDSAFTIQYIDYNSTAPSELLPLKKRNDTLIVINNMTDFNTYYFIPR